MIFDHTTTTIEKKMMHEWSLIRIHTTQDKNDRFSFHFAN